MKEALIKAINEIIELLEACNWPDKANWFKERLARIEVYGEDSKEFLKTIKEVQSIIAGMGSFSDLPLVPRKGTSMSKEEAARKQWELGNRLDAIISAILQSQEQAGQRRKRPTGRRGK